MDGPVWNGSPSCQEDSNLGIIEWWLAKPLILVTVEVRVNEKN